MFELPVIVDEDVKQIDEGLGLALRQVSLGYALGNERNGCDSIGPFFSRGELEPKGPLAPRRDDALENQAHRGHVVLKCHSNKLPREGCAFAIEQRLGRQRCRIPRALQLAPPDCHSGPFGMGARAQSSLSLSLSVP